MASSACHDRSSKDSSPQAFSVSSQDSSSDPYIPKTCIINRKTCLCLYMNSICKHFINLCIQCINYSSIVLSASELSSKLFYTNFVVQAVKACTRIIVILEMLYFFMMLYKTYVIYGYVCRKCKFIGIGLRCCISSNINLMNIRKKNILYILLPVNSFASINFNRDDFYSFY